MAIVLPHSDWPTLPYLETIQRTSEQEAKVATHARGRSEYAHIAIRIEPSPIGTGVKFENRAGASIPDRFVSSIQSGVTESLRKGPILGAEITDIVVTLTNGSYHEQDSNERAFQSAGRNALEKAVLRSMPVLLEPIMRVQVTVSEEFVGELSNEITRRRGEVKGMEAKGDICELDFWLPLSEAAGLTRFASGLSFGQSKISMQFLRYEKAPPPEPPDGIAVANYT